MKRLTRRLLRLILFGALAFMLLKVGEASSPAGVPGGSAMPITNAFLFLCGLGSAIALLSPRQARLRRVRV